VLDPQNGGQAPGPPTFTPLENHLLVLGDMNNNTICISVNAHPTRVNWVAGTTNRVLGVALEVLAIHIFVGDRVLDHLAALLR